jgi:hypothetical protein
VGALDNNGEALTLIDNYGALISSFSYSDAVPWPAGADGNGATLVFTTRNPLSATPGDGTNWFAHGLTHGNPGGADVTGYASWATSNGASANGAGDGDHDGIPDVLEYLLGSNPAVSDRADMPAGGILPFTVDDVFGNYLTLTYTRAAGTGDINVICETATNLAPADWAANAVLVSRTYNSDYTETYLYRGPMPISAQPQQFMRLRVALP